MNRGARCRAFTLIELLFCAMIVAVSSVGVMNLLRLSEAASLRAQLDGRAAYVFSSAVDRVLSYPYDKFSELVNSLGGSGDKVVITVGEPSGVEEARGVVDDLPVAQPRYLLSAPGLPGQGGIRDVFAYTLRLEVTPRQGYYLCVLSMRWEGYRDRVRAGRYVSDEKSVRLEFRKWDVARL